MPEPLEFQVVADLQDIVSELKGITAAQRGLTTAVKETDAAVGPLTSRLNTMSQAMSSARAQTQGLRDMSRSMMLVGAGGAALSVSFVTAAAKMESMNTGLKAVAGSSAAAEKQMAALKELAKSPAFSLESAMTGSIRLQAAGLSAKQAEEAMKGLAAALVVAGKGPEEMGRATLALSQMATQGKISQQEINQLAEAGINVGSLLRDQFQLTAKDMGDLGKAFQERGLTVTEVIAKMTDSLQKKWGPAAKDAGNTASNAFANFSDAVFQARVALGESLLPTVTAATQGITKLLEATNQWSPAAKAAVGVTTTATAGLALVGGAALNAAANFGMVKIAMKETGFLAGTLSGAMTGLKASFAFLTAGGNPIVIAIEAIAGAIVYLAHAIDAPLKQSLQSARNMFAEAEKQGRIAAGQGPRQYSWWERTFTNRAEEDFARPIRLDPRYQPPVRTPPASKAGPVVDMGAAAHARVVDAEVQLKLAQDTERELAARQKYIMALQEQLKYTTEVKDKESLRLKIAGEMHDRTALIRDNIQKQAAEQERAARKVEQEDQKRADEWERLWRKQEEAQRRAAEQAERWAANQREAGNLYRATAYDQAKRQGDLATMQMVTQESMKALEAEGQRLQKAGDAASFERARADWLHVQNQYLDDATNLQKQWGEAAKRQQDAALQAAEKQRQLMERIGDAVERRVKAEEDALTRKEDRERSVRERAARWYQDVAQQAAKLGNLPMAREFAARGGQLAQEAAGMGIATAQRNIGLGGAYAATGLDQMMGAFGQGNFSQADVYAMSRWMEQGMGAAGGPEALGRTALPTGVIASTLAPQQVVQIFLGEAAIATNVDPSTVGAWFQNWYNREVARQQVSAPR